MGRGVRAVLLMLPAVIVATGCAGSGGTDETDQSGSGVETGLLVLASTDVYASLVQDVVADTAQVEAIVDSPAVDPHSYEATPQDRLSVEEADVLIANGGGYDPYITQLASAAEKDDAVIQLISGENWHSHEFDGTYENEHVWYDLARMSEFVSDVGDHMGQLEPENAQLYEDNAQALADDIDQLHARTRAIEAEGLTYLATEAVSGFLLDEAGFDNLTDIAFLAAVEHGDDVSPRLFFATTDTIAAGEVDLLSYNRQTQTNQSLQIREAAEEHGVEILEFSETLPEGLETYTEWMEQNIADVERAAESLNQ